MSFKSESVTSTSGELKKPPACPASTGTPAAASSRRQTGPVTFAERSRTAMSPYSSGLSPPGLVSMVPPSTSSRIRWAALRASRAYLSGASSSPSAAEAKTSSSGSGTEPVYGSAATSLARSSYSSSPRPRLMRQEKTEFTAATISGRERKLSRRNTRLGSPSGAGASAKRSYFSRKMPGSARRKRYMLCLTSPTMKSRRPSMETARIISSCTRETS